VVVEQAAQQIEGRAARGLAYTASVEMAWVRGADSRAVAGDDATGQPPLMPVDQVRFHDAAARSRDAVVDHEGCLATWANVAL